MSPATYDLLTILLAAHRADLANGRTMAKLIHGTESPVIAEYTRQLEVANAAQDELLQHLPTSEAA